MSVSETVVAKGRVLGNVVIYKIICCKPFVLVGHCNSKATELISVNGVSLHSVCETAFPTSSSVMPHVILTDGIPWSFSGKCSPVFVLVAL